jgi:2-polyprenyl-3-methyl-5-hydroxy-6-metoxy-1,4-benzoquinol methylase
MEDWLAATVRRLRELACGRILEIGCGTGLIVEALAPLCQEYRATDLSGTAVRRLRTWLDTREDLRHVEAIHAAAHDVGSEWSADLIILNSVIQYFPDSEYLGSILDNAWNCLRPGGHISQLWRWLEVRIRAMWRPCGALFTGRGLRNPSSLLILAFFTVLLQLEMLR